jgi:hypothetical protein
VNTAKDTTNTRIANVQAGKYAQYAQYQAYLAYRAALAEAEAAWQAAQGAKRGLKGSSANTGQPAASKGAKAVPTTVGRMPAMQAVKGGKPAAPVAQALPSVSPLVGAYVEVLSHFPLTTVPERMILNGTRSIIGAEVIYGDIGSKYGKGQVFVHSEGSMVVMQIEEGAENPLAIQLNIPLYVANPHSEANRTTYGISTRITGLDGFNPLTEPRNLEFVRAYFQRGTATLSMGPTGNDRIIGHGAGLDVVTQRIDEHTYYGIRYDTGLYMDHDEFVEGLWTVFEFVVLKKLGGAKVVQPVPRPAPSGVPVPA